MCLRGGLGMQRIGLVTVCIFLLDDRSFLARAANSLDANRHKKQKDIFLQTQRDLPSTG